MDRNTTTVPYETPHDLAGRGQRLGARLIDYLIGIVIVLVPVFVTKTLQIYTGFYAVYAFIMVAGWFLAIVYFMGADAFKGQSLGKRAMNIRVVDEYSSLACKPSQAVIRNLSLFFLGIVDALFIFSGARKRLGDMMASTVVVRV